MIAEERYGRGGLPLDLVPLSDGAGEVVEVGPEVDRVKPGDRVAGIFMQSWIGGAIGEQDGASALGSAIDGVLADPVHAVIQTRVDGVVESVDLRAQVLGIEERVSAREPKPELNILRMSADSLSTIVLRSLSHRTGTVARPV